MSNTDPLVSAFFTITGGDQIMGVFRECVGIGSETEVVEEKVSGPHGQTILQKVAGRTKYTDITLKRGITSSTDMWQWRRLVEQGKVEEARSNVTIQMHAHDGQVIAHWNLSRAWPSKIIGPTTNATNGEVGIEELTIVHEGYERVQ